MYTQSIYQIKYLHCSVTVKIVTSTDIITRKFK